MSQQEAHKGKLILRKRLENEVDKEYFKRVLGDKFEEAEWDDEESLSNFLGECDLYEDYFYANDKLYENTEHLEMNDNYIKEMSGDDINGYDYFMSFHNGGTCLTEMIEESLDKLNRK